jgi:tetratricopeptide (TPR) repeat protein
MPDTNGRIFIELQDADGANGAVAVRWQTPDGQSGAHTIPEDAARDISEQAERFMRLEFFIDTSKQVVLGKNIFQQLNGPDNFLGALLDNSGETFELCIRAGTDRISLWPFELLDTMGSFHILRPGRTAAASPGAPVQGRRLALLFMACSPTFVSNKDQTLNYEAEEEAIYKATGKTFVDLDFEDSGSLRGLHERLETHAYNILHLSGHADIHTTQGPVFLMENQFGEQETVRPIELWNKGLKTCPPQVVFVSGCRTGESRENEAASSFCEQLVEYGVPAALGWGRSVDDAAATRAAELLYHEMALGRNLFQSVSRVRETLRAQGDVYWPFLRIFTARGLNDFAIVTPPGHTPPPPRPRATKHKQLVSGRVKVLDRGFVGRRREMQTALRALLKDEDNAAGVLLHGTGGLGKSTLAGKLIQRMPDYHLIIIRGRLDAATFINALEVAFARAGDHGIQAAKALNQLKEAGFHFKQQLDHLCASVFPEMPFLFLLDNFEDNMIPKAARVDHFHDYAREVLEPLLEGIRDNLGSTRVIMTSRFMPPEPVPIDNFLLPINPPSLRGPDEKKKAARLPGINQADDDLKKELIAAGKGNPKLLELIDEAAISVPPDELKDVLKTVRGQEQDFIAKHISYVLIDLEDDDFAQFMNQAAVFHIPVPPKAFEAVSTVPDAEQHLQRAVEMSLIEADISAHKDQTCHMVSPLIRKSLFQNLDSAAQTQAHQAAAIYLKELSDSLKKEGGTQWTIYSFAAVDHALTCKDTDIAAAEAATLISFFKRNLAYEQAMEFAEYVANSFSETPGPSQGLIGFYIQKGLLLLETGTHRKALADFENARRICAQVHNTEHSDIAAILNNMGSAYEALGDAKRAIEYFEKALKIDLAVFGDSHPNVAIRYNNLGESYRDLGEVPRAIEYFEKALKIDLAVFGDSHPNVAISFNNLGLAYKELGDAARAIEYFEKALKIFLAVFGDSHPNVAISFNNLGLAYKDLGDAARAIEYFEQALKIDLAVFGDSHPMVATRYNNLGSVYQDLGDAARSIEYFEKALNIDLAVFGDSHPKVAIRYNNLGSAYKDLGDAARAIEYFEKTLTILDQVYDGPHPYKGFTLESLADLLMQQHNAEDFKKGLEMLIESLKNLKATLGNEHPDTRRVAERLESIFNQNKDQQADEDTGEEE